MSRTDAGSMRLFCAALMFVLCSIVRAMPTANASNTTLVVMNEQCDVQSGFDAPPHPGMCCVCDACKSGAPCCEQCGGCVIKKVGTRYICSPG